MHTSTELQSAIDVFRGLVTGDPELARSVAAPTFTNRETAVAPPACAVPGPGGLLASSARLRAAFDDLRFPVVDAGTTAESPGPGCGCRGCRTGRSSGSGTASPTRSGRPPAGPSASSRSTYCAPAPTASRPTSRCDDVTMLGRLGAFPPKPAVLLAMARGKLTGSSRRAAESVTRAAAEAARPA